MCLCWQTSAYSLFLPGQDSRSINDAYALQDGVGHLGTHEPGQERGRCRAGQEGEEKVKRTASVGNGESKGRGRGMQI